MDDVVGSFLSFFRDMIDPIDPFPYLHRLINSVDPVLGAAVVGIPIVAVLLAPVGYLLYWESEQDKRRRRREKARMAKYRARTTGENRPAS
jgi:hypothetical protein